MKNSCKHIGNIYTFGILYTCQMHSNSNWQINSNHSWKVCASLICKVWSTMFPIKVVTPGIQCCEPRPCNETTRHGKRGTGNSDGACQKRKESIHCSCM